MWAVYAIISLIVLLIAVLSIPFDFVFKFDTSAFHGRKLQVSYLWGLLRFDLNKPAAGTKQVVASRQATGKKKNKKKLKAGAFLEILQVRGLFTEIKKLLRNAWRSSRIRHLKADIIISPEDPLYFGYLYVFLVPLNHWLSRTRHQVIINPVFEGQLTLECAAEGEIRTFPILLVGGALAFIFSRPGFKIMRIMGKQWR